MNDHSGAPHLYFGTEHSFDDILYGGRRGGAEGLSQYLRNRLNELSRKLSSEAETDRDKDRILVATFAMKDALILIEMLRSGVR